MKVVAFGASTSTTSINKKLAAYAASLAGGSATEILDLNDFEIPLFSEDKEKEIGQPEAAARFLERLGTADYLIISFAEHNGAYSAAYKNLFDWCTRINPKVFQSKPILLLSTSPGGRGGKSVLELATNAIPRFGGDVRASLSIPNFYENFDIDRLELSNTELKAELVSSIAKLISVD